jgi:hypothetical protein
MYKTFRELTLLTSAGYWLSLMRQVSLSLIFDINGPYLWSSGYHKSKYSEGPVLNRNH